MLTGRSLKTFWLSLGLLLLCGQAARAAEVDTIVVMPFENRSQLAKYNWVRESFAILLGEVLDVPGMKVVSASNRNRAFEKMRLNSSDLLTRAAMIRVADAAQANLALIGEFDIGESKENATIAITARLIETREGRLVGNRVFNFSGPLADLQQWQGELAWSILYHRNPSLPYARDVFVRRAQSVPPRAYETYVKAVQTQDVNLRESYLRRALQEYETANAAGHYAQAIYELGLIQYRQGNYAEAIKQFKEITKDDPNYVESLFYLGLANYKANDYGQAATIFEQMSESMPALEILSNAGAAWLAKGDNTKALGFLRRALANSPNDPLYRFNYGYALWRNQQYAEATENLRAAIKLDPRDGEAHLVLAKALAASGQTNEASQADNEAKRYLENYAKWAVTPEKMPLLVRLKVEFNRAAVSSATRQTVAAPASNNAAAQQAQQTMAKVRALIDAGQEGEAMNQLQAVLNADATNSDAHYLRGVIYQRIGQTDNAISELQQAVSRNPRMADAHVALGQIYLGRGDRPLALAHCKQALELDPQNRNAVTLKQQIELGR